MHPGFKEVWWKMPLLLVLEFSAVKYCALGLFQQNFERKENVTQITKASLRMNAHHPFGTYA